MSFVNRPENRQCDEVYNALEPLLGEVPSDQDVLALVRVMRTIARTLEYAVACEPMSAREVPSRVVTTA